MKTLALLIASGAMLAAGLADAQAQSRHNQGGSAKHWGGGHGGYGGYRGHGGYRGQYGYGHYRPYFGAYYRGYPYYPYSSFYAPFPLYVAPAYYGYSYPYPEPVYVERRAYVEPRSDYYAPPPPMAKADPQAQRERRAPQAQAFGRYTLSARELFEFDRSDLNLPQPKLDEIAVALKQNPQVDHVTITGHTDRLGSEAYNQKLSERRAQTVKQYLVSKGVEPKRLEAVGRGESQPVVDCTEKTQSALIKCLEPNRRVEVEQITIEARPRQAGR